MVSPFLNIPRNWKQGKFDDISELVMGHSPPGDSYNTNNEGFPLINGPVEFTDKYPIKRQWTSKPTRLCRVNDLLFCVRGSSTGRINIADDTYCIGRGIAAIRAKEGFSSTEYIKQQLQYSMQRILRFTAGSTFPSIDKKTFNQIEVVIPPLPEQEKIAEILGKWDQAIEKTQRLIEAKEKLKKGLMQQLLTGKMRFKEFKGQKWRIFQLQDICLQFQNGGTPSTQIPEYWKGNIPWVTGADFDHLKIKEIRKNITEEAIQNSSTNLIEKGDLLLVTRTGVGKMAIAPFNIAISQDITGLRLDNKSCDAFFLLSYLNHSSLGLSRYNQGTSINGITRRDLKSHKINLPPLKEQQKIALVLNAADKEIKLLCKKLEELKQQKKGLMQKLLTGKTRVKV